MTAEHEPKPAARLRKQAGRAHAKKPAPQPTTAPAASVQTASAPVLLDHAEAARLLGMSDTTLKRMARAGKIGPMPVKFSSRLVRWPEAELRAWAASGDRKSVV